MDTIIAQGTARNIVATGKSGDLSPDPAEHRFVTYTNDLGAVHTIIVDVEHAIEDGEKLLRWFHNTRAAVTHLSASVESSPGHLSPADVLKYADEAVGIIEGKPDQPADTTTQAAGGGV